MLKCHRNVVIPKRNANSPVRSVMFGFLIAYLSLANASWTPTSGPGYFHISTLATVDTTIYAGTSNGMGAFFSRDNGKTWVAIDLGKSYTVISAFVAQDSFVFAGATNSSLDGGIFRSISTSNIWIAADSGLTTRYITSLAVNGNNIYAGTDRGVFLSANNGGVWKALNSGLPSKTGLFFQALVSDGNTAIAGTNLLGAFRSVDNGIHWTAFDSGFTYDTGEAVFALAKTNNFFFAGTSDGMYRTSINGNTWTKIDSGIPLPTNVTALAVCDGAVFAGTWYQGVFLSVDNGSHWTQVNSSFPQNTYLGGYANLKALAVNNNYLFAGFDDATLFVYRIALQDFIPPSVAWISPKDNAQGVSINPILEWGRLSLANSYSLQISVGSNFSTRILDSSGITDTVFPLRGLAAGTTYSVRINAKNFAGPGGWDSTSFTTLSAPSVPQIVAPKNDSIIESFGTTLVWKSALWAASYRVRLFVMPDSNQSILDTVGLTDTTLRVVGLFNDTAYCWRVNAANMISTSAWSALYRFSIDVPAPPTLPNTVTLVSPENGALLTSGSAHLLWLSDTPYVSRYSVAVGTDSLVSQIFLQDSAVYDTTRYIGGLSPGVTYWWRAKAYNAKGWGPFCSERSFKCPVLLATQKNKNDLPFYFNSALKNIRYTLTKNCLVSLQCFDVRGRVIARCIINNQSPGSYSLDLPISPKAIGIYIVLFRAGSFEWSKAVEFVK